MPAPLYLRRLALVAAVAAAAGGARAELIKVSPFLPPQGSSAAATPNAPLEYMGSMVMSDTEQFRVVDPAKKTGTWLKVGERDPNLDIVVKQHDADQDTLTVEHGGQTMTLPLHSAKIVSSGTGPQMIGAAPAPMPNVSPAVISTVVPNPTPADEQRRLEAVAAEVARRRAMREQAAQQQAMQAGAAPGTAPIQPNVTRQDMQQLYQQQRPQRR